MSDKPPILDSRSLQTPQIKRPLSFSMRMLLAVLAVCLAYTMLQLFIAAATEYCGIERGRNVAMCLCYFLAGLLCAGVAYYLWIKADLKSMKRPKTNDKGYPYSVASHPESSLAAGNDTIANMAVVPPPPPVPVFGLPEKPPFYWRAYPPPVWTTVLTALAFALTVVDCLNDSPPIGAVVVVFLVALAVDRWIRWTRKWRAGDSPPAPLDSRIGFGFLAMLMTTAAAFMLSIPLTTVYAAIGSWRVYSAFGLPELAAALEKALGELLALSLLALPFGFIAYLIWQPVGWHFLPRWRKNAARGDTPPIGGNPLAQTPITGGPGRRKSDGR